MTEYTRSFAKLNLFLEVLGKRDDGFHELETVMFRSRLYDRLTFAKADAGHLSLQLTEDADAAVRRSVPTDESNLVLRAARALLDTTGQRYGAQIVLDKQIPVQAGLGGGSSNAATALRILNELWQLHLPLSELHRIAATLGSDINFFVQNCEAAVCLGRGEKVHPVPVGGAFDFVALRPEQGNSTPAVFSQLPAVSDFQNSDAVVQALKTGSWKDLAAATFNRLTAAGRTVNSEMAALMDAAGQLCERPVCMSGSGSTCFVVCASYQDAQHIRELCEQLKPAFLSIV